MKESVCGDVRSKKFQNQVKNQQSAEPHEAEGRTSADVATHPVSAPSVYTEEFFSLDTLHGS